jgi:hypothetical protein
VTCEICSTSEGRLVRDHNHSTGMIRGMLCNHCNCWLGVYEANLNRERQRGKSKYKVWVIKYESIIKSYLAQDKGIIFRSYRQLYHGVDNAH